jgi:hypothetical protein
VYATSCITNPTRDVVSRRAVFSAAPLLPTRKIAPNSTHVTAKQAAAVSAIPSLSNGMLATITRVS